MGEACGILGTEGKCIQGYVEIPQRKETTVLKEREGFDFFMS